MTLKWLIACTGIDLFRKGRQSEGERGGKEGELSSVYAINVERTKQET